MSQQVERPVGYGHHVATRGHVNAGKAVAAAALVTATALGIAYAIATPFTSTVSSARASAASANLPASSEVSLLSAGGLDSLLHTRFVPVQDAVVAQGSVAAQEAITILSGGSGTLSSSGALSPDGTVLTLTLPAIAAIGASVQSALAPIGAGMAQLGGSGGQVASVVNNTVVDVNPALKLTGPNATLSANVPIDLDAAVVADLTGPSAAGAVALDPHTGTVTVDLSKLLSSDVLASQTGTGQPLSPIVVAEIGTDINAAASVLGEKVVNSVTTAVEGTPVDVNANVHFLTQPTTTSSGASGYCSTPNSGSGSTSSSTTTPKTGLLGGTLGSLLGGVVGTVGGVVCSVPSNLLPAVLTTLSLNLDGKVGQIIEGTAPSASGTLSMLGEPTPFDANRISYAVANTLVENFVGPTGGASSSSSGHGSRGSSSGGGTSTSSYSFNGSDTLGLGLTVGTQPGSGNGSASGGSSLGGSTLDNLGLGNLGLGNLGLGGLNIGGITGLNGTGITAGILKSLTSGTTVLPLGISATVGSGSASGSTGSTGSTSSSSSNLLNVHAGSNGTGLNASVNVGSPIPATVSVSAGGSGSTPATGSSASSTSSGGSSTSTGTSSGGILGLHIGTSTTGGTTSGQTSILNLGL